ncbi:Nif11-like leader peptide family natural product precursor [Limnofasciculus baicalensis]|uniref:Nif11-like leader peptide family natural product n=1 Tax=Limnofasciculus baicalensis BBK-W-15 TaxID=2699891 RepID=A0AAE3GVS1_9CYAN|nr:Nif11-like leader peptide family natural product precursor [Limnofasciculus baicalensis]MCP2731274.1 Nif11-like leader peptide family natural product precursor [Limnofasciculus baicalensis BBK-W-15]
MWYQIWEYFFASAKYSAWKKQFWQGQRVDKLTWEKVIIFLSVAEENQSLKAQLKKTISIEEFMGVVADNGFTFTLEELGKVVITQKQIWDLFSAIDTTLSLKEELIQIKSVDEFIQMAVDNDYYFTKQQLSWLLTGIKLDSTLVSVTNSTGDSVLVRNIGGVGTANYISLGEEWGIVPPFCHIDKRDTLFSKDANDPFLPDQCLLPRGYFNQYVA